MQETYTQNETVPREKIQPQSGGSIRRVFDFSEIDFSDPEVQRRLGAAYRVWWEYRTRRLAEQQEA
jgi:hypothetical protein